jgi:hypothetical protein
MTVTFGFWALPVAVVIVAVIVALIADPDFRNNTGGMLGGCLGMLIVLGGLVLAAGLAIGGLLA